MEAKLGKKWYEMLKVLMVVSEEELKAIDHQIPMTQELFNSIMDKIVGIGIEDYFYDFMIEYQQFLVEYGNALEDEIKDMKINDRSPEEKEKGWKDLCDRLGIEHEH